MKSETKALVDRANQLRTIALEKTEEKKRYWDTYSTLVDAMSNAPDPESLWAAQIAYKRHSNQAPPSDHEIVGDWHRAIRVALDALGVDAGIDRRELE